MSVCGVCGCNHELAETFGHSTPEEEAYWKKRLVKITQLIREREFKKFEAKRPQEQS
jgi:hypothetical protein